MAITSPVTLSKIHAEFGGSGPLSDYVRGGTYVPNGPSENNSIATVVSSLKMSQFLGARDIDLTPNSFGWASSYLSSNTIFVPQVTIAGVEASYFFGVAVAITGGATITVLKNGVSSGLSFSLQNGNTLSITLTSTTGPRSGTVTLTNTSENNAVLASFTYNITDGSGGGF